ncbi:MAG: shikimate dehydrogenase [Actinomycetota bacterium]
MAEPDAGTLLLGVVGHPVRHSLSPAIQNAALRHDGRNAIYLAFEVAPDNFEVFVEGMRAAGVRGLNVTLPHKRAAFDVCTTVTEEAQWTEAVNTMTFEGEEVVGDNTDIEGVRKTLLELGAELDGAKILVIGAGGAGRAAARASMGSAGEIWIANRTPARAEKLRGSVGRAARVIPWKELADAAVEADVIVHTTSVGLSESETVLKRETLEKSKCKVLLDLVYGPGETKLVLEARGAGIRAADGLAMLVLQGAEAYVTFWDTSAPVEVMRQAALDAVGRAEP